MSIGYENLRIMFETIVRSLVEASVDTGVAADTSTVDYLDDPLKDWPENAFTNLIVEIAGGTGEGQIRKIASNTATRLVVDPTFTTAPDSTSTYRIGFFGKMAGEIASWGGAALTPRDISQDIAKLDIALSALRDAISGAAPNSATLYDLYAQLATSLSRNIASWGGAQLTGRDISQDLAKLDTALSALRDAITAPAPNNKTLNDLYTRLGEALGRNIAQWGGVPLAGANITANIQNLDMPLSAFAIYSAPITGVKTVTATAAEIFAGASRKTNRRLMVLKNEDSAIRFRVGGSSVSQQNGFPVEPRGSVGSMISIQFNPNVEVPIYAISEGADLLVAVMEL